MPKRNKIINKIMHVYIYDSFVNEKKNNSIVAKIETRITDLGLSGKIIRLNVVNSIFDAIENEIKKGAKTIIAVGGDKIFNQTVNAVAKLSQLSLNNKIPVGFIPVGKKNTFIADILGIEDINTACDILSARIVKRVSLGKINDLFFVSNICVNTKGTIIEIDQNYTMEISENGLISVINLPNKKLELIIKAKKTNNSSLLFKNLQIVNKKSDIIVDNAFSISSPVKIRTAKEKIDLIVGKKRKF